MRNLRIDGSFAAALSFLALTAACGDDGGNSPTEGGAPDVDYALLDSDAGVTLRAEAERFEPGAPVTLILENNSDGRIGYNLCVHALEERTDEGWDSAPVQPSHMCILPLYTLEPSESASYEATIPEDLGPGEYRFRVGLELFEGDDFRDQVSNPFEIEG